jgi:hypothetical protein
LHPKAIPARPANQAQQAHPVNLAQQAHPVNLVSLEKQLRRSCSSQKQTLINLSGA